MGPPRCRFCGAEFETADELWRHYRERHAITGGGEGDGGTMEIEDGT